MSKSKKNRAKFKMKGFSVNTEPSSLKQSTDSAEQSTDSARKYVFKHRVEQFRDLFRPIDKKKASPIGGDRAKLRRTRKQKKAREKELEESRSVEHLHGIRPGEVVSGSTLNEDEQKLIQKSILKQGHFGDIPPSLLKGYKKGTNAHRRRVAEINAHHDFLVNSNPYNRKEQRANLHQKLSALKPENWENRYSDFTGHDTYDEHGNPRYPTYRRKT